MTRRTEQLASTLQQALQEAIAKGLSDPRVSGLITITAVNITPDLKHADVLVSVYPEDRQDLTLHGLQSAARHLRRRAGELVAMKQLPELRFRLDLSLKRQARAFEAISRAVASTGSPPPDEPADAAAASPPPPDAPTNAHPGETASPRPAEGQEANG